jgi:Fe-S cluster assembly protein SufD
VSTQQFRLERGANVSSTSLSEGGGLVRNDIRALLAGEGCECTLNGLYLATDHQVVDHHMWVEHKEPNCNSH